MESPDFASGLFFVGWYASSAPLRALSALGGFPLGVTEKLLEVLGICVGYVPRDSRSAAHVCRRSCQRIWGKPARRSSGLKCRLTMFCRHRPLQGAVQTSQQLVELRLLLLGKSRHLLVHEILVGRYNLLKKPPPLLGEVETVGPPLLVP